MLDQFGDHLVEMKLRMEGLRLVQQALRELGTGDNRQGRNVIDRLFRIKLGALPAGPVENINDMAFDVEQAQFKNRKQTARARANDHGIGGNYFRHLKLQ